MPEVESELIRRIERGEQVVLATVVRLDGEPPSRTGAKALFDGERQLAGTLGCSEFDSQARTDAPGLLAAGSQADVLTIAVDTTRWGQGVGSELLRQLLAEAKWRGCTEVFLEVRADNARAQRLYHWWGFAEVGIRRGYYQPSGVDAVVMRKVLR